MFTREEDKRAHVRALNLARRHLNQEGRRKLIADQLRDTPEKSDRQIAAALGVSSTTVGSVGTELEATGDVSKLDTSTDTLGRQQPRERKPARPTKTRVRWGGVQFEKPKRKRFPAEEEGRARAGVTPRFQKLNGQEPVAFILSANVARRHLSKGQQAMAVARAHVFLKNTSQSAAAKEIGVSRSRMVYAVTVLEYAPELADAVLAGDVPLNDAYEQARQAKLAAEGRGAEAARAPLQLAEVFRGDVKSRGSPVAAQTEFLSDLREFSQHGFSVHL